MSDRSAGNPAEAAWLSYAARVVRDEPHRTECAALGGSPEHRGVDAADVRWPGYIGSGLTEGNGLVVVGSINRGFVGAGVTTADRDRLVQVTRGWRDGLVDDATYLAVVREVYLTGLRTWVLARQLRHISAALAIPLEQTAFVTAARCQYPEVPPALPNPACTKATLQASCLRRFPMADLLRQLQPQIVLYTSPTAFDLLGVEFLEGKTPIVCIHQYTGQLSRPLSLHREVIPTGTSRQTWIAAVAQQLADGPGGPV